MDNNDRFIQLYNQLDSLLGDYYHEYDRNKSMVMRYVEELQRSGYAPTYERGRKLNLARVIRNLLVHDLDMNADGLITINENLLTLLTNEINLLLHPSRAMDIMTKVSLLFSLGMNDLVSEKLHLMIKRGNMQVPVLDTHKVVVGVFSPNTLLMYLANKPRKVENLTISDVQAYLPLNKHISEHYEFVSKSLSAQAVSDLFDNYYKKGQKLVMVFVTEHGKSSEGLLGIITPYDVVNLSR